MDYHASDNGEVIDQKKLNISDGSVIYGGKGNDTIIFGNANVLGGAGNDTFQFYGGWGAVVYWDAPAGVQVDLAKGTAQDGFGGTDTLTGVMNVQGNGHDDTLIGNSGDNAFFGNGGNDTIVGGGGNDVFTYYDVKSSQAKISYDLASDTFTIVKNFSNGDHGTDHLTGVNRITFVGDASDHASFERANFAPHDGFLRASWRISTKIPSGAFLSQIKAGDFNGDGNADWMMATQIGTGTAAAPSFFFSGSGDGHFTDATASLLPNGFLNISGGGRTLIADFNNDGRSDMFQFNFGNDAPPFPGGLNALLLSSALSGTLIDQSATLAHKAELNHAGSAGDVNGDGYLDLLVNTLSSGNLLYINNGNGQFTLRNDLIPYASTVLGGVAYTHSNTQSGIVDVNGDGHFDLILGKWDSQFSTSSSLVLLNDGTGNFTKSAPIALPSSGVANEIVLDVEAIDLNHDGRPDLMLSVTNGGSPDVFYQTAHIQLLINDGAGKFHDETDQRIAPALQAGFGKGGWIMSLTDVDMDHDGNDDILATSASDSVPSVLLMNKGDGTFGATWNSGVQGRTIALDVNNDGMTDLLTYDNSGEVAIDLNVMGRTMQGGPANDALTATSGNDHIDGGAGVDAVRFPDARSSFTIAATTSGYTVTDNVHAYNVDALSHVERLAFSDCTVALDIAGDGGQAYRIYQAAFNRTPDQGGLGFWISILDKGASLTDVAGGFVNSAEWLKLYGANPTNTDVVVKLYQNVLHRLPDPGGLAFWGNILDTHAGTVPQVLAAFSESPENQAALITVIGAGFTFTPYAG